MSHKVEQLVGVAPLVVIPGNQLYKVVVQGDACACVEGGGVYIVDEIGRNYGTKQGRVLHPNGLSLAVDNIAKESPTFAELGAAANWGLKFNHKNVKMGMIKSNG